jgi:hypothetical protein
MSKYKGTNQTDQDLIRAIGYITDMNYIASYYGVDVKRVIALRDKVKKPSDTKVTKVTKATKATKVTKDTEVEAVKPGKTTRSADYSYGWNNDAERKWNKNAKEGSAALLKALLKFFGNRERRLREQSK